MPCVSSQCPLAMPLLIYSVFICPFVRNKYLSGLCLLGMANGVEILSAPTEAELSSLVRLVTQWNRLNSQKKPKGVQAGAFSQVVPNQSF